MNDQGTGKDLAIPLLLGQSEVADPHRTLRLGIDHALRVARQAAARHDAMQVRMMVQILAPGVQHRQHADLRPQPLQQLAARSTLAALLHK